MRLLTLVMTRSHLGLYISYAVFIEMIFHSLFLLEIEISVAHINIKEQTQPQLSAAHHLTSSHWLPYLSA